MVWAPLRVLVLVSISVSRAVGGSGGQGASGFGEGIGDPTFPSLGNTGYHASHYHLKLAYDPVTGQLQADVVMTATADRALSQFAVDFSGFDIQSVTLDGKPVQYVRTPEKLELTTPQPIASQSSFSLETVYSGVPQARSTDALPSIFKIGWVRFDGGAVAVCEPDAAHSWFPCNDHPLNKATFDFEIRVPAGFLAAANGTGQTSADGTYKFHLDQPTLTCMATVAIGKMAAFVTPDTPSVVGVVSGKDSNVDGPGAGTRITSYLPVDAKPELSASLSVLPQYIKFLSDRFGPYPFDSYGVIAMPKASSSSAVLSSTAIETTTIPVYGYGVLSADTLIHELTHQWFGDEVSITNWGDDIWWVEGMAQYAEFMQVELSQGKPAYDRLISRVYSSVKSGPWLKPGHLSADKMFSDASYMGGALTFAALRAKLGDDKFFQVLHDFIAKNRFGNASVKDWIDVSTKVAGMDMKPFFDAWLYGDTIPQM